MAGVSDIDIGKCHLRRNEDDAAVTPWGSSLLSIPVSANSPHPQAARPDTPNARDRVSRSVCARKSGVNPAIDMGEKVTDRRFFVLKMKMFFGARSHHPCDLLVGERVLAQGFTQANAAECL